MACERQFKRWKPSSPNILKLRTALRHRKSLVNNRTRLTNQLHAMDHSAYSNKQIKSSVNRLIKQMEREIEKMENLCVVLYEADEVLYKKLNPIIDSIKGVGLITALTIIAETNGFAEITSRKQLASYAGYDIIENQSGNSNKPTRISKQGNARIRSQMYMATVALIRSQSGPLYKFYERVRERNPKIYKIANVAVQRKLLLLIYTLYKNGTQYDPEYHQKHRKKNSPEPSPELCEIE
jgi:transposase